MSSIDNSACIASPPCGDLRGSRENGIEVYRGVRYAQPPVGELRFAPPQPVERWARVRDATNDGPIPPQGPSRLAAVMGDFDNPQSEDCLSLTIWTPKADGKARPVVVWVHGGAYSTGAGSLEWHSGEQMARAGDVVVVSVNFRLGALGFLYLPGVSDGNMALLDLIEALKWIQANIAAFGGDPANVTAMGQSSGGSSIVSLLHMPAAHGLFRRAIVQSAPLGRPERLPDEAAALGERFASLVDTGATGFAALKTVPVEKLVAAQGPFARSLQAGIGGAPLPFMPVVDGVRLQSMHTGAAWRGAPGCDVLIGTTREEMAAAFSLDAGVQNASHADVKAVFDRFFEAEADAVLARYRRRRPRSLPAAILGDLLTDRIFRDASLRFARRQHELGNKVFVYRFDWQSPAGLQACHCLEIPFVFNNLSAWSDAPMLRGVDEQDFGSLADVMQQSWVAFARHGDPNHEGVPEWPQYGASSWHEMHWDHVVELVGNAMPRLAS